MNSLVLPLSQSSSYFKDKDLTNFDGTSARNRLFHELIYLWFYAMEFYRISLASDFSNIIKSFKYFSEKSLRECVYKPSDLWRINK